MHSIPLDGAVDQARLCRAPEREVENMFVQDVSQLTGTVRGQQITPTPVAAKTHRLQGCFRARL
jgi:hypothetical protein